MKQAWAFQNGALCAARRAHSGCRLWNAPWQINKRQAAPLRTRVERAPGYILRAKNQVIEQYVKYDSVYKQIILKIIHTHMQPYYSIFPSIDWFYASIYDSFRVSREPEQASLMF